MAEKIASVTTDELARLFGISRQQVGHLTDRGVLKKPARNTYPLVENVQSYTAHLREVAAGRGGEAATASLTAERARLAREQADEKALKNASLRGELIPAEEVKARWVDVAARVRGRLLAVASRLQGQLTHLSPDDVEAIDAEVRMALGGIADGAP
ncbi:MAG: hypothetical protein AAGJ94_02370 [Pseudomonadota bacterium]